MKTCFAIGMVLLLSLSLLSGCVNRFPGPDESDRYDSGSDSVPPASEPDPLPAAGGHRYTFTIPQGMTQTDPDYYQDATGLVNIAVKKEGMDIFFGIYTADTLQRMSQLALDNELGEGKVTISVQDFSRTQIDGCDAIRYTCYYDYDRMDINIYQLNYMVNAASDTIYIFNFTAMNEALFEEWEQAFTACAESIRFTAE